MTLLYDSKCGFCNTVLAFFERHVRRDVVLHKHDLRTTEARSLLRRAGVQFIKLNTVYLLDDSGNARKKSAAVLHLLRYTAMPYRLLAVLRFLPRRLSDLFYDLVAANRYRISNLFFKQRSNVSCHN